jgi:hypothetical protein
MKFLSVFKRLFKADLVFALKSQGNIYVEACNKKRNLI